MRANLFHTAVKFVCMFAMFFGVFVLHGCKPPTPLADESSPNDAVSTVTADEEESSNRDTASHDDKPARTANRLAKETSPYLLLHAHNPVDWYAWSEEAFAKAKKENKPIFLSVGYSSCYWCHVMERESFMDEEIAKYLNENFICIKVDREERPDVDDIYMTAVNMLGQRGGWPLSVFMTPEGKPFFGGTYWPARKGDRESPIGFLGIVRMVHEAWDGKQELIEKDAETLATAVRDRLRGQELIDKVELNHEIIEKVASELHEQFDPKWGGFGYSAVNPRQPKFPEPSNLLFLIERVKRRDIEEWEEAEKILKFTLDKMSQGGIYDHLGGGFHRYSTDRFWHIPHFEKMLYDNGQLASIYAEAYDLTKNEAYRHVVDGILQFVQREMLDEGGGFYAALAAETDAEEGKFYRWTKTELDKLLSDDERELFGEIYNLNGEPNFRDPHSDGEYYVPLLTKSLREHANEREISLEELLERLRPTREKMFAARSERKRPLTDTKILTSWNGLMIRGFADAGRLLDEPAYTKVAARAADFVLENLREDGRLLRTHTAGEAKLNGYLVDYALLVDGLLALHKADGDAKWLEAARAITDKQIELFWDENDGGFYFTSDDHEALIARAKNPVDTVIPSGNSVAAGNLLALSETSGDEELRSKAHRTMISSGVYLRLSPGNVPRMAVHIAEFLDAAEDSPE